MSSKAVLDVSSIKSKEDLRSALMFAGIDVDDEQSESLLAVFRSTDAPSDGSEASKNEVGIWTGSRNDRSHNPFERRIRHVLGASPSLDPELVRSTIEHLQTGAHIAFAEMLDHGARIEQQVRRSSSDKTQLMSLLDAFCLQLDVPNFVTDSLGQALDELFTNAVYNAPPGGKQGIDRTESVTSERPVTISFGADTTRIGISVRDEYGSLDPNTAITNLSRCYEDSVARVQEKRGGAGIGLFMLLQGASRMVINIEPFVLTEVAIVRDFTLSRRAFSNTAPTLNICVRE